MRANSDRDETVYTVVLNHAEMYSIWPAGRPFPAGWTEADKTGSKEECLAFIELVWTDMRPRGLREQMDRA
jgi:MbtH protein